MGIQTEPSSFWIVICSKRIKFQSKFCMVNLQSINIKSAVLSFFFSCMLTPLVIYLKSMSSIFWTTNLRTFITTPLLWYLLGTQNNLPNCNRVFDILDSCSSHALFTIAGTSKFCPKIFLLSKSGKTWIKYVSKFKAAE